MATLQRDGFAGYTGGHLITAPVRVRSPTLTVSVDGGSGAGVRVGIVGSAQFSVTNCVPIRGKQTDVAVAWTTAAGAGSDRAGSTLSNVTEFLDGAIALEFEIADDAVAFAFAI